MFVSKRGLCYEPKWHHYVPKYKQHFDSILMDRWSLYFGPEWYIYIPGMLWRRYCCSSCKKITPPPLFSQKTCGRGKSCYTKLTRNIMPPADSDVSIKWCLYSGILRQVKVAAGGAKRLVYIVLASRLWWNGSPYIRTAFSMHMCYHWKQQKQQFN